MAKEKNTANGQRGKKASYYLVAGSKQFTGYSAKKSILSGLAELVENKFMARGPAVNIYYINPTVFFNGDRLIFIEQYELER